MIDLNKVTRVVSGNRFVRYPLLFMTLPLVAAFSFYSCGGDRSASVEQISSSPGPASGLILTPGNSQVSLEWSESAGTQSYDIYWNVALDEHNKIAESARSSFRANMYVLTTNKIRFDHKGLHNGWQYNYWVVTGGSPRPDGPPLGSVSPREAHPCLPGASCAYDCSGGPTDVGCDGLCKNLSDDPENCGACGNECQDGDICREAICFTPAPRQPFTCPALTPDNCGGSCVNSQTNVNNCGACGSACAAGQLCQAGACVCDAAGANPDMCGGTCVNTQTDVNNCGACGSACAAGQLCQAGACVCDAAGANPDMCGGTCVNTQTNTNNCGACGNACAAGRVCTAGACVCPASNPDMCGGICVNTQTNTNNCGACGNACAGGRVCSAGACVCPSYNPNICGGTCVNLSIDSNNCGACGTTCTGGSRCFSGACFCYGAGSAYCNGACTDTRYDSNNCGACGTVCPGGTRCNGSVCI